MNLSDLPIFFLDFQTTGPKPETSQILEMAWGTKMKDSLESFIVELADGKLPPRHIQEITGIKEADMELAQPLPDVFTHFRKFLEKNGLLNSTAVIHFAQFEKPFLTAACESLGFKPEFNILCTHEVAKRLFPNLPTRGIKGLAGYFGYPVDDLKRSACHVEATQVIWEGLTAALAEKNILTIEDLTQWLVDTPKVSRTKYEYPLPKEKRLGLTKKPGVYRMISKSGEILYVGKATCLRDRVNSYFRGQKNRDPRKLEMLTQVWDLQITPCETPLEAAILETDEIKRINPRYNVSLKTGQRMMVFYDKNFHSHSRHQDEIHQLGPFSSPYVLDSVLKLSDSIKKSEMNRFIFFDPIDPELIATGLNLFCERHGLSQEKFKSPRSIIALGLWWHRELRKNSNQESEILSTEFDNVDEVIIEDETLIQEFLSEEEILELSPEDIAEKFERHFIRAAKAYWRARQMTKLLNSEIDFQIFNSDEKRHLVLRRGQIASDISKQKDPNDHLYWRGLDIQTYDRMTVLTSELAKIKSQNGFVHIKPI